MASGGETGNTYQVKGVQVEESRRMVDEHRKKRPWVHSYYLNSSEFPYETKIFK